MSISALAPTSIPTDDEALRADVRAFLTERLAGTSPAARARSWMGFDRAFTRDLAARGWVGLTLPTQYGGGGRSHFTRFVLNEELLSAGAPVAAHWIAERQSAPLLLNFGTEAQRERYIPAICRGEAVFCIGMSEPGSGSDLASVTTNAVAADGGWVLNGAKIWTTNGHCADYMIALVRTSGSMADRHAGLSQLVIDLTLPGITRRPIHDLCGDAHFSEIRFDDVRLAQDALVGEEGGGWGQVTRELAFERSGPERFYSSVVLLDGWLSFLRESGRTGAVEAGLAGRLVAEIAVLREMSLAVTAKLDEPAGLVVEASIVKDLGTTFEQRVPDLLIEHIAGMSDPPSSELLEALHYTAAMSPSFSLRGGTREVLRGIIARGLGLR